MGESAEHASQVTELQEQVYDPHVPNTTADMIDEQIQAGTARAMGFLQWH